MALPIVSLYRVFPWLLGCIDREEFVEGHASSERLEHFVSYFGKHALGRSTSQYNVPAARE